MYHTVISLIPGSMHSSYSPLLYAGKVMLSLNTLRLKQLLVIQDSRRV